ncbi:biliverdin-producing heme oxygenase [Sphingomonas aracearum]|uniref:Heme oxygenase n=1 Tax=Sphingomonas aracearum TaxID=2283317 RepID=A0A369W074_9SPHN|nr:biliverdin-producing heme oxygenase [Sphingomonas aracearum]RDE05481.1 hypothetical protein DVW87_09575 [Sphingomonas aracearum]
MKAHLALRHATRARHEEVDAAFGRFRLDDRAGYAAFLQTQAAAHLPVERALEEAGAGQVLPDWAARRRAPLLRADLADLGMAADELPPPSLTGEAAILGAIYVLEGSRLGGAYLVRGVPLSLPRRFLSAPAAPGSWRALQAHLDARLADDAALEAAITAADTIFACFATAGRQQLELS